MPPSPLRTTDDRAASPVIGVILLVAIVVVLAAVFGTIAIGFTDQLREPAPTGGFETEYAADGAGNTDDRPYATITHEAGRTVDADDIVIRDESGNTVTWSDVWTAGETVEAGEYVHIDGFGSDSALDPICEAGQTYWIIIQGEEDETLLVTEWTVPAPPDLPSGSPSDSDNDGIPDWC
jgi:flagellin-like protein